MSIYQKRFLFLCKEIFELGYSLDFTTYIKDPVLMVFIAPTFDKPCVKPEQQWHHIWAKKITTQISQLIIHRH